MAVTWSCSTASCVISEKEWVGGRASAGRLAEPRRVLALASAWEPAEVAEQLYGGPENLWGRRPSARPGRGSVSQRVGSGRDSLFFRPGVIPSGQMRPLMCHPIVTGLPMSTDAGEPMNMKS